MRADNGPGQTTGALRSVPGAGLARRAGCAVFAAVLVLAMAGCSDDGSVTEVTVPQRPTDDAGDTGDGPPVETTSSATPTGEPTSSPATGPTGPSDPTTSEPDTTGPAPTGPTPPVTTPTGALPVPPAGPPTSRENCVYSGGGWLCAGGPPGSEATGGDDGPEGSGCTPTAGPLPDGVWFGLVDSAGEASIEFDLACWFSGEAAVAASRADGHESPPPNDYYVRNNNPTLRTLTVSADAEVVIYPTGIPSEPRTGSFADYVALGAERGFVFGVWVATEGGQVTGLHEQWVP